MVGKELHVSMCIVVVCRLPCPVFYLIPYGQEREVWGWGFTCTCTHTNSWGGCPQASLSPISYTHGEAWGWGFTCTYISVHVVIHGEVVHMLPCLLISYTHGQEREVWGWGFMHIYTCTNSWGVWALLNSGFCSLSQWLTHQKTCPQCRVRCLPRNVLKLFIDSNDSTSLASSQDPRELKVHECTGSATKSKVS